MMAASQRWARKAADLLYEAGMVEDALLMIEIMQAIPASQSVTVSLNRLQFELQLLARKGEIRSGRASDTDR